MLAENGASSICEREPACEHGAVSAVISIRSFPPDSTSVSAHPAARTVMSADNRQPEEYFCILMSF